MSKFKDKIDKELSYIKATNKASDIIAKVESKNNVIPFKRVVAMVAALVLVFTVIFIPAKNNKSSFMIIANAESSADSATSDSKEITGDILNTENFVEIESDEPNYIYYNFNYVLDENAESTDLVKKYLFHSFNKHLNISVDGENIETITYKINKGSLSSYTMTCNNPTQKIIHVKNTSAQMQTEMSIDYEVQDITSFKFNPVTSQDDFHCNLAQFMVTDTGEITRETSNTSIIGYGHKDDNTLATEEEIETLRQYIKNDDMVGFYNYQNQIFKRLIDSITLDITITKTNGKKETQTLEFLYTPDVLKELPKYNDAIEKQQTLSTGTLSAKIKE